MTMAKKKVKKRLNVKALLVLILIIYLIYMIVYSFLSMPIKNIYITGTSNLSDNDIIEAANIKNYPSMLKLSSSKIEKNLKKMDYIEDVKVRRNLFGKLTIDVVEAKILFYNRNTGKLVLSNGKEVDDENKYGYPSLINYVPKEIYSKMISSLKKANFNILYSVSEMEYSVSRSGDKIIDDTRFIFRMNDGNTVYINLINIKNLNKYQDIYATVGDIKGVMYLDSSSNENIYFKSYESIQKEANSGEEEKNE
ncbi:MAG: FtsQ-type POTRA domain-containing protein [Firmicutes bacterium]|nr:FtsQ-type POTRA domain-containing protein [Bacillota bacterium]